MTNATYLSTFFAEKDLGEQTYEATAPDGTLHLIPTGCVIEAIMRAPEGEQAQIVGVLRQIDFKNGNVHHFLNHLAGALAARY
jgi:hypothetical protein